MVQHKVRNILSKVCKYGQLLKYLDSSQKYGFWYGREIVKVAKYIVQTLQSMDNVVKTLICRKRMENMFFNRFFGMDAK